jgi:hypothetical protein
MEHKGIEAVNVGTAPASEGPARDIYVLESVYAVTVPEGAAVERDSIEAEELPE